MATEVVVGIDFGTTHSGVSWAVNRGDKKEVRLVNDWPNPLALNATHEKIPSKISYEDGKPLNWGYKVRHDETSFRWFKLFLDPEKIKSSKEVQISQMLFKALNKTPETVVTDYLSELWQYTMRDITRVLGDRWQETYKLKVVLTVPAIWSPKATDNTKKAAWAAGMPQKLGLVSEPEAAALAVLKGRHEYDPDLKPGDVFVVCDAGGGTVDLISYKVRAINPLRLDECVVGEGGLCGSVFVDEAFEKHIQTIVGSTEYNNLKPKHKITMLTEFENVVKRQYTGETGEKYSVQLVGVEDNREHGIVDETIILKDSMVRTMFDHVANQIVALVHRQVDEVKEQNAKVKAILLVGGFGDSKYLHRRLKSAYQSDGLKVLQVNRAWSSICRGATMWGLENDFENSESGPQAQLGTVCSRLARLSYGIRANTKFVSTKHQIEDRYINSKGEDSARDQMFWIIKRGQRIEEGQRFEAAIWNSMKNLGTSKWLGMSSEECVFSQTLYCCADKEPPMRYQSGIKELCSVKYALKARNLSWVEDSYRGSDKKKWRDVNFKLRICPGSATLHFAVFWQNKPVAWVEAKYEE